MHMEIDSICGQPFLLDRKPSKLSANVIDSIFGHRTDFEIAYLVIGQISDRLPHMLSNTFRSKTVFENIDF